MRDKDALELLNMFTLAAQNAKAKNKYEFQLKIDENALMQILRKAFPSMKSTNIKNLANNILQN